MNWSVFFTRLGTAVFFCAVMLTGLLWRPEAFIILMLTIQFLCIKEFYYISERIFPNQHFPKWMFWLNQIVGLAIFISVVIMDFYSFLVFLAPICILLPAILNKRTALHAAFCSLAGLCYIAIPLALFFIMYNLNNAIPLALVLLIWTNDTMAYISGSFIGRTPFSSISPKKTWEGIIGGFLLTIVAAALMHYFHLFPIFKHFTIGHWIALTLCASFAGNLGDLLESKLKRIADIKDSGNLLPGHGGALDRFDSLLVAIPPAFCAIVLFF